MESRIAVIVTQMKAQIAAAKPLSIDPARIAEIRIVFERRELIPGKVVIGGVEFCCHDQEAVGDDIHAFFVPV